MPKVVGSSDVPYHSDAGDYIRSMRRLRELPVRVVHGGHFPSFSGERLRGLIDGWLREKGI
jgi:glyoxylase-like metal-dependent hydrolase (beta-lactamase superfamily II)